MRKALTVTAIAAAFTFLPVTSALAQSPSDNENQVDYWCDQGEKFDDLDGQTFEIPVPPSGFAWTKLILNGGQDGSPAGNVRSFVVVPVPAVGTVVTRPGAEVSNAILCYEPKQPDPTTTTSTTTTSTTTTTTQPATTTSTTTTTTQPATTTTQPATTTTQPATTTTHPATTTTHPATTTTHPATTTTAPHVPVTTPPPTSPPELPTTGTSPWGLALAALASLIGGVGMMKLSRRTT